MDPTPEQQNVRDATRSSDQSLMVSAYAGCAKTTTLELAAQQIKVPGLALAFNKSIRDELSRRFPPNFSVQTMNGLGFKALARAHPQVNFKIEERKVGKLVTELAKRRKIDLMGEEWEWTRDAVRQAQLAGLVPREQGQGLTDDSPESWRDIVQQLYVPADVQELVADLARETLVESNELVAQAGIISFDDQIYYPTVVRGMWPQYPLLMVDEAQDLSPLNHQMLLKAARPDARFLVCGDPKQAIYAFRGADSQSMASLRGMRSGWVDLPLTLTFRCPRVVVERQQGHAPGFRAAQANRQGRFAKLERPGGDQMDAQGFPIAEWGWADVVEQLPRPDASVAVLCRNNAPLLSLAFKLIRQRVPPIMLGRDIGQGLVALSRKLFPDGGTETRAMLIALREWEESESQLALLNDQSERLAGITDRAECLRAVIDGAEVRDARALREALQALFSKDSGRVTLASIHRAKGLEWDVVLHLDPWRIPSRPAREAAQRGQRAQLEQEYNLRYVCETRTREVLLEANVKEFN